jgi:hypothetical protein
MNTHFLLESALRSLIMGATVFAALRLLRIHQVRAQRTAWLLALVGSLAMPALVALRVGPRVLPAAKNPHPRSEMWGTQDVGGAAGGGFVDPTLVAKARQGWGTQGVGLAKSGEGRVGNRSLKSPISLAALIYLAVAGFLLLRLVIGLGIALRLRNQGRRAVLQFGDFNDIRVSTRVSTPVTIASTILLPESYAQWDEATLRIVLTHERAHVRQSDFVVQLLAGLHCVVFWFNPFSWWLQRELSALGEAMSDLAAVEEAESRVSYAEVLLEFATHGSWLLSGVAMARSGNLRPRIERLLSDRLFRQSSSGKRRLGMVAGAVVVLALVASTSLVRVHAAQATAVPAPMAQASAPPTAPAETPAMPDAPPPPPAGAPGPDAAPPTAGVETNTTTSTAVETNTNTSAGEGTSAAEGTSKGEGNSYAYSYKNDGDSFALVTGDGNVTFNGDYNDDFKQIRRETKGEFIYYKHAGKAYVIQDPTILARANALYAPMQELGRQQEALGKQQEELGKQQEDLGRKQSEVKIPTPDLKKELASLNEAMEQLKKLESKPTVDQETLSDLQGKIGDIQGRLGDLQGQAGELQGKFGEEQGKLGEQQGKLGDEQGKLGEKQGKLAEEADRQLKPMVEQAIREGKAKPVE